MNPYHYQKKTVAERTLSRRRMMRFACDRGQFSRDALSEQWEDTGSLWTPAQLAHLADEVRFALSEEFGTYDPDDCVRPEDIRIANGFPWSIHDGSTGMP